MSRSQRVSVPTPVWISGPRVMICFLFLNMRSSKLSTVRWPIGGQGGSKASVQWLWYQPWLLLVLLICHSRTNWCTDCFVEVYRCVEETIITYFCFRSRTRTARSCQGPSTVESDSKLHVAEVGTNLWNERVCRCVPQSRNICRTQRGQDGNEKGLNSLKVHAKPWCCGPGGLLWSWVWETDAPARSQTKHSKAPSNRGKRRFDY